MNTYYASLAILLSCSLFSMEQRLPEPTPILDFTNTSETPEVSTFSMAIRLPASNKSGLPLIPITTALQMKQPTSSK